MEKNTIITITQTDRATVICRTVAILCKILDLEPQYTLCSKKWYTKLISIT